MCRRCIMSDWPSNSFQLFLLVIFPHMKDMISVVLIYNERIQWFMAQTLCSAFVQGIVDALPLFFINS